MITGEGRICIIVAGMHRSGTSALSRFLSLLGCSNPKEITGPNESNQTGHWEPEAIRSFNDEFLAKLGSRWDDLRRLDIACFGELELQEWRRLARNLMRDQYGDARVVVLKDPRICRLLSFWLPVVRESGFDPRVVIPVRQPHEVAASLSKRDGGERNYWLLLWMRHVLEAEFCSRNTLRSFVTYDRLLADWASVSRQVAHDLQLSWPALPEEKEAEIRSFLDIKHRHHESIPRDNERRQKICDDIEIVNNVLTDWALKGERAADFDLLNSQRESLADVDLSYGNLIWRGHIARTSETEHSQTIGTLKRLLQQTESLLADQAEKARIADLKYTELWHAQNH